MDNKLTISESLASSWRVCQHAKELLAVGPGYALLSGCVSIFGIASVEGWACLRPGPWDYNRARFVVRYGLYQIVPSVIWLTQPSNVVAAHLGLDQLVTPASQRPPHTVLLLNRLRAIRGAIAGSVLLSQVFSFTHVISQAKHNYAQRISLGREPPLSEDQQTHNNGVVIRLAGNESDTTALHLERRGRRTIFPVFEDPSRVESLVQKYSCEGRVPMYWQVDNSRYSYNSSWNGLKVPEQWVFSTRNKEKLLILEADATCTDTMSLRKTNPRMDLDMYEASQGFHQLQLLAKPDKVLRVLLVDSQVTIQSGGGHESRIRDFVAKLALVDVMVDARQPLLLAMKQWLDSVVVKNKVVLLETPRQDWFQSISRELGRLGYKVMDCASAVHKVGDTKDLAVLVYERTSADTVHTIRQMVEGGLVPKDKICALLDHYEGLTELEEVNLTDVHSICSSVIYDDLLQQVRQQALDGLSWAEIQENIDEQLER